jgi:hypothetical protein
MKSFLRSMALRNSPLHKWEALNVESVIINRTADSDFVWQPLKNIGKMKLNYLPIVR